jgi:tRNA splicing endonuclease
MMFHAAFVVILREHEEKLAPLDIVSFGRLGVSVKKSALLASLERKQTQTKPQTQTQTQSTTQTTTQTSTNNISVTNLDISENEYRVRYFSIEWLGVT